LTNLKTDIDHKVVRFTGNENCNSWNSWFSL